MCATRYSPGRVLRTHGPEAQPQVLSRLLASPPASLRFLAQGPTEGGESQLGSYVRSNAFRMCTARSFFPKAPKRLFFRKYKAAAQYTETYHGLGGVMYGGPCDIQYVYVRPQPGS